MKVVALSAGMSDASSTTLLAHRYADALNVHADVEAEVVTLRELAHDITDATLVGFASPRLQAVIDQVVAADALVVVTPIYKASFPGLFKSFVDALDADALTGKPVALAATGGTARHSLAVDFSLRPLFAYLQTVTVPTGVFASPHDWGTEGVGALQSRVERAVDELLSLAGGHGTGRGPVDSIDLFSETMLSISDPRL